MPESEEKGVTRSHRLPADKEVEVAEAVGTAQPRANPSSGASKNTRHLDEQKAASGGSDVVELLR